MCLGLKTVSGFRLLFWVSEFQGFGLLFWVSEFQGFGFFRVWIMAVVLRFAVMVRSVSVRPFDVVAE